MPLEKPVAVAAGPVESAKRNELTAGRARSPPRVREQRSERQSAPSRLGSSPRVRGAVGRPVIGVAVDEIIPARAGSRNCRSPRWCC